MQLYSVGYSKEFLEQMEYLSFDWSTPESVMKANLVQMGKEMQLILFYLNTVLYGVDVNQVQVVLEMLETTKVPKAPHYIEGVTNPRESVIVFVECVYFVETVLVHGYVG